MHVLLVADIHSNLTALQAVLKDAAERASWEAVWCLGDVVGYGPDPQECLAWLREQEALCLAGNHDLACIDREPLENFNEWAADACRWTSARLTADERTYLAGLPVGEVRLGDFTLVHGSLRDPVWEYVYQERTAAASLQMAHTAWCIVGHSHLPVAFAWSDRQGVVSVPFPEGEPLKPINGQMLCNPGSVGQPRDGDPRAAYAIVDTDASTVTRYRVGYDIEAVQGRMRAAGLPERLATRLSRGL